MEEKTTTEATTQETTTLDWFLSDLANLEIPMTAELMEKMVAHARDFIAAGGIVTWERWAVLGAASRKAFIQAASELRIRNALEGA